MIQQIDGVSQVEFFKCSHAQIEHPSQALLSLAFHKSHCKVSLSFALHPALHLTTLHQAIHVSIEFDRAFNQVSEPTQMSSLSLNQNTSGIDSVDYNE